MKLTLLATVLKHQAFVFLCSMLIPMAAMAYTEHSGTIPSETWGPGTHYVTASVTVSDGQVLTIMPGAVIKFAPDTQMTVNGTLRAVGVEVSFIIFTSRDDDTYGETISGSDGSPSRGDWTGIHLNGFGTYDGIGDLDYCRIRYGGGAGGTSANVYFYYSGSGHFANSISEESAIDGIRIANCSPQIIDNTFESNGNHGLYAEGSGVATVTGNIFTDNNQYAVYLNQTAIPPNIFGNTGSGNGTNGLVLAGRVTSNQSWSSVPGFPIVLLSQVTVNDGIRLMVASGTVIKFGEGIQLLVQGTLDANGSAGDWVVFTSLKDDDYEGDTNGDGDDSSAMPGDWAGIYLNGFGTYDGIGEFDYCRIRYGGNAGGTSANVYFYDSSSGYFANSISEESAIDGIRIANCSPQITYSTVASNGNHGLYAEGSGAVTVTGNIFTDDNQYAVYLNQTTIPPNISGNTGSGNGINGLVLAGRVAEDQSWSSVPGFPIVLLSQVTVNDGIRLMVASGTVIKFGEGIQLLVQGTLDANGSAGDWVVFTSLKDDDYDGDTNGDGDDSSAMPGDWAGIYLNGFGTYDGIGEFDYCRIRYGGNAGGTSANVYFYDSSSGYFTNSISEESAIDGIRIANCSPQITYSTVASNGNHGLYAEGSGAVTVTGNIFTDNNQYAVYLNQTAISPTFSVNTGNGNDTNGLVLAGTVAVDQSWSSVPGFPIVLLSEVTVNDSIMLTVAAGTIIKFGSGAQLTVRGTLDANASAGDWVVFTSLKDDDYDGDTNGDGDDSSAMPGDWAGIYLNGYGTYDGIGEFDYCRIRYGGNAGGTSANVYFYDSSSGYFTNSISEESAIDGIRITSCSPQISNNTFSKNSDHGLTVLSGSPSVTNCILWGDGGDEISGSPSVTFSDIQGGYAGVGNINKDPLFIDPDVGDYHLDFCSPAIDAGDPVENLTADYIFGEFVLSVDRVTAVMPGDPIWITDSENYEIDEVDSTTAFTVTVLNGFFNSYAVADRSYMFTATSDFTGEPAPNGRRINMGAYGGSGEAVSSFVCRADLEGDDLDVDGADLIVFMGAFDTSLGDTDYNPDADFNSDLSVNEIDLAIFAEEFGRTDCPFCP